MLQVLHGDGAQREMKGGGMNEQGLILHFFMTTARKEKEDGVAGITHVVEKKEGQQ
jgi:hypothetical protein